MKRILCLLLLICLAVPAAAFAEGHEYIGRMMVVNCKREVSLRAEPTKNSERLDWVPYHAVLENCYSGYGDYYYVEYFDMVGYIHEDYLEVYDGPDAIYWSGIYEEMQIVGAPGWTPLREMADADAKQLAKVPLGAVLTDCEYYADDYTYVHYNGMAGYVLTEYITLGSGSYAEPDLSVKYVTNCEEKVSLRAKPSSSSERLAWVPKGAAVEAIGAEDGYFYVCYDGQYGYIFGDYLANIGYTGHYVGEMVVTDDAVMYAQPAPEFGQLTSVPVGTVVDNGYKAHDGYYWVCYNDVFGYIHGDDLQIYLGDAPFIGEMQVIECAEDTEDGAWMYGHANWSAEWIKKVPLGAIVSNCHAYDDDFIYAEYDGYCGFIGAEYLGGVSADIVKESYDAMRIVNCGGLAYLYEHTGYDPEIVAAVPLGGIVTDCMQVEENFFYCCYDGVYGYIDGYYLEAIEGPYSDSDDILSNTRTTLNSKGVGFGVYLVSDSMGGDWSILQERHHLKNVLSGMPEEWWPVVKMIPEERIIEIIGGNHLFMIVPSDEYASVTVYRLKLGADGFTGIAEEVLYQSMTGEPFLLRCNEYDFAMDSEILIVETDGDEYGWYPDVHPTGRIFEPQVANPTYYDLTVYDGE